MTPVGDERAAREEIDRLLSEAGWDVCDMGQQNLLANFGTAIREFPLKSGHGHADYLLYMKNGSARNRVGEF